VWQLNVGAAQAQQDKLAPASEKVKEFVEKVLKEEPQYENYGKTIAQQMQQDARGGNAFGQQAAIDHPWKQGGNPNTPIDWFVDSFLSMDARFLNIMNWSQMWSCFEPKLLAKAKDGHPLVTYPGPGNEDLIVMCRNKCPNAFPPSVVFADTKPSIQGMIKYRGFGCTDPNPFGYLDNGYEIAEYWFPEYEVSVNNYGINRIEPTMLPSPTGGTYTRQALIGQKQGPEKKEQQALETDYPMPASSFQNPNRQDPLIGQGVWGGYANPDYEDKGYGHVVRSWLSVIMSDKKIKTDQGWMVNPEKSLYDALPKKSSEHDPVNVWTEYGDFDVITSMPHMSSKIRPDLMKALYDGNDTKPYSEVAAQTTGFWQSKGAMAYRVGKWKDIYGPLEKAIGVKGDSNGALKEAVYYGGYELFPLVTNQSGFGSPTLATAAVIARRTLYLAGATKGHGDEGGVVAKAFPQGEKMGRINTYTIDSTDKSREIDKMQLISPKRPHDGSTSGGPIVSECFRSQNIPNLVNLDGKLEKWVNTNLSRKLPGYYSDTDFISPQGGDVTFMYWNRRIGCFCDRCGLPTGSSNLPEEGGDGDKLYDKPRQPFCRYPLYPTPSPWNAWAKQDNFPLCMANGLNEGFYDGTGLKDKK